MPLYLPDNYPISSFVKLQMHQKCIFLKSVPLSEKHIKLAVINIMPEAEKYEELIIKQLVTLSQHIEISFVKLKTHQYKSTNKLHLENIYETFEDCVFKKNPDALIITGAPVELLDFELITYYDELMDIMNFARQKIKSTLGICWAGIFIGHYLGVKNHIFNEKIFGVFPAEYCGKNTWLHADNHQFLCPQSRYAGIDETQLSKLAESGLINILCKSEEAGSFIFESADHKFVAHMGHPEYEADRIMFEYLRDQRKALGINPKYFDVENPSDTWKYHSSHFFAKWIELIED